MTGRRKRVDISSLADIVLDMDVQNLSSTADQLIPLKPQESDPEAFYDQYPPLIIEEVISAISVSLSKSQKNKPFELRIEEADQTRVEKSDTVTVFMLNGERRVDCTADIGGFNFIVSMLQIGTLKTIAILNIFKDCSQIVARGELAPYLTKTLNRFSLTPLCSLTNLDRMYNVCVDAPDSLLLTQVRNAKVSPWSAALPSTPLASSIILNDSQAHAVNTFSQADEGLYLLQGPPGTGKTTTIITLLHQLLAKKERILVCAPSNKAVQVLAERALTEMPDQQILMTGVESKIPDRLQEICMDGWVDRYPRKLISLLHTLQIATIPPEAKTNFEGLTQWIRKLEDNAVLIQKNLAIYLRYHLELSPPEKINLIQTVKDSLESYIRPLRTILVTLQASAFPKLGTTSSQQADITDLGKQFSTVLPQLQKAHDTLSELLHPMWGLDSHTILETANILFCTLSTAGRNSLKWLCSQHRPFTRIIIDEAGQAVEAEALIAFNLAPEARTALLVGDTRQLPATTLATASKQNHFEWSMMWRLLEENRQPFHPLTLQYRMRSTIRHFPGARYYEGQLVDHPSIEKRKRHGYFIPETGCKLWVDSQGSREEQSEKSFLNRLEAVTIVDMVKAIRLQDKESRIGVISFYSAQVQLIRKLIQHAGCTSNLLVSTVDGFQGDEKEIILVSFVRANLEGGIGFLRDFRRLNVAITRAKDALIICGNCKTFENAKKNEVTELLEFCRDIQSVISPQAALKHIQSAAPKPEFTSLPKVNPIRNVSQVPPFIERGIATPLRPSLIPQAAAMPIVFTESQLVAQAARYFDRMKYEGAIENYQKILQTYKPSHPEHYYLKIADCYEGMGDTSKAAMMRHIAEDIQRDKAESAELAAISAARLSEISALSDDGFSFKLPKKKVMKRLESARGLSDNREFSKAEEQYMALLSDIQKAHVSGVMSEVLLGLGWCLHKQYKNEQAAEYFTQSLARNKTLSAYQGLIQCYRDTKTEFALELAYECLDYFPWSHKIKDLKEQLEDRLSLAKTTSRKKPVSSSQSQPVPTVRPREFEGRAPQPILLSDHLFGKNAPLASIEPTRYSQQLPRTNTSYLSATVKPNQDVFFSPSETPISLNNHWSSAVTQVPAHTASEKITTHAASNAGVTIPEIQEARRYLRNGEFSIAQTEFTRLLARSPTNPDILAGLGVSLHLQQQDRAAIPHLEASLAQHPVEQNYATLTICYKRLNQLPQAIQTINNALHHFPNSDKLKALQQELRSNMPIKDSQTQVHKKFQQERSLSTQKPTQPSSPKTSASISNPQHLTKSKHLVQPQQIATVSVNTPPLATLRVESPVKPKDIRISSTTKKLLNNRFSLLDSESTLSQPSSNSSLLGRLAQRETSSSETSSDTEETPALTTQTTSVETKKTKKKNKKHDKKKQKKSKKSPASALVATEVSELKGHKDEPKKILSALKPENKKTDSNALFSQQALVPEKIVPSVVTPLKPSSVTQTVTPAPQAVAFEVMIPYTNWCFSYAYTPQEYLQTIEDQLPIQLEAYTRPISFFTARRKLVEQRLISPQHATLPLPLHDFACHLRDAWSGVVNIDIQLFHRHPEKVVYTTTGPQRVDLEKSMLERKTLDVVCTLNARGDWEKLQTFISKSVIHRHCQYHEVSQEIIIRGINVAEHLVAFDQFIEQVQKTVWASFFGSTLPSPEIPRNALYVRQLNHTYSLLVFNETEPLPHFYKDFLGSFQQINAPNRSVTLFASEESQSTPHKDSSLASTMML